MTNNKKSKYTSLAQWAANAPDAFEAAVKQNLLPEICESLGWELPTAKNLITKEDILSHDSYPINLSMVEIKALYNLLSEQNPDMVTYLKVKEKLSEHFQI